MTSRWLIFAAWAEDDVALLNSHWSAQQTARLAPSPAHLIERGDAVREVLETALARDEIQGAALFAHGNAGAVVGSDGRGALDADNLHLVARRWVHAIACETGKGLVLAAAAHADLFVGYDVSLMWSYTSLEDLPDDLRERMAGVVTVTTLGLLNGIRTKVELQERARIAQEAVAEWLVEHPGDGYFMAGVLAQQLVWSMVLSR